MFLTLVQPVPGPSAIAAQGGRFRQLPGEPGYVAVSSTVSVHSH